MVRVEGLTENQPDKNFIPFCVFFLGIWVREVASDLSVLCGYGEKKKKIRPLPGLSTSVKQDVYFEALNETCTICIISKFCTTAMRSRLESQHTLYPKWRIMEKEEKGRKSHLKYDMPNKDGVIVTTAKPGLHTQAMGLKNTWGKTRPGTALQNSAADSRHTGGATGQTGDPVQ